VQFAVARFAHTDLVFWFVVFVAQMVRNICWRTTQDTRVFVTLQYNMPVLIWHSPYVDTSLYINLSNLFSFRVRINKPANSAPQRTS
jgi:hypothetical protein